MNQPEPFLRFFGVAFRSQTYLNLLYLVLAFPLGVFYFVFLVTGLALGFSLLIIWVGLVILVAVVGGWWVFAQFERQMAIRLLHESIPPMSSGQPEKPGILPQLKQLISNPVTWKALVYLFARFPLGILALVALTTLFGVSGVFLSAPIVIQYMPIGIFYTNGYPALIVDQPAEAALAFLIGLVIFLISLHLLNGLAWVFGRFARLMLGDPQLAVVAAVPGTGVGAVSSPEIASQPVLPPAKEISPMKTRSNIALALILIAIGGWFLSVELFPAFKAFAYHNTTTWPIPILGIGAAIALIGLLTWTPDTMIPAAIVAGVGGLLYWQNATDKWGSWAYAWALIPGFVGIGVIVSGLMNWNRKTIVGGLWTVLNSLILFGIFGAFLGGFGDWWKYWPVLVIAAGVMTLIQGFTRRKP